MKFFAQATTIPINKSDVGLPDGPTQFGQAQLSTLLDTAYIIAGIVAVVMIIIGGLRYVTSNGDSSQIQSAKNTITYAVIGLVVIISAAAITQFVTANVTK